MADLHLGRSIAQSATFVYLLSCRPGLWRLELVLDTLPHRNVPTRPLRYAERRLGGNDLREPRRYFGRGPRRRRVRVEHHVLGGCELSSGPATARAPPFPVEHVVEEVPALLVAAEGPGLHGNRLPACHLGEMPDMGLHGVEVSPERHVLAVRSREAEEGVGRVPGHLEAAALGHVAVEAHPVGGHAGRVQLERPGEVVRLGPRGAVGAGE